jgi:hypothetical protein
LGDQLERVMKRLVLISIALNVVLTAVALWIHRDPSAPRSSAAATAVVSSEQSLTSAKGEDQPEVFRVSEAFHWSQVESTDYTLYVANLRAVACPEDTIRDIITADVNELYDLKVKQMVDGVTGRFWELFANRDELEGIVDAKLKELNQLKESREQLLASVLSDFKALDEAKSLAIDRANMARRYEFLSPEMIEGIQRINREHSDRERAFARDHPRATGEERGRAQQKFAEERLAALKALMTPEEFAEFTLRNASGAETRYQMGDVNLTEEEMRSIAKVRSEGGSTAAIQGILGAERYAEFQLASEADYNRTLDITDRHELPSSVARQVYEMQRAAQAQAKAVREDEGRSAEERQLLLQALQQETEQSIGAVLGPQVFRTYQKHHGGWLNEFGGEATGR